MDMPNPFNKILYELEQCDSVKEAHSLLGETFYIYGADSFEFESVEELYQIRLNELLDGRV
jgi:hypothetical protein